jgi:hypothetical protein
MIVTRFTDQGQYTEVLHTTAEGAALEDQARIFVGRVDMERFYHDFYSNSPVAMSARPSQYHTFNYATKQWEDPRPLNVQKEDKWSEIKALREQSEHEGFTWDSSVFDSDAVSQGRINGAVTLALLSPSFTIGWTLKDNSTRTLSQTEMLQVGAALGTHVATQFAKGQQLRSLIEAATTKEGVEAVVW